MLINFHQPASTEVKKLATAVCLSLGGPHDGVGLSSEIVDIYLYSQKQAQMIIDAATEALALLEEEEDGDD